MKTTLKVKKLVAIRDIQPSDDELIATLSTRLYDIARPKSYVGVYIETSRPDNAPPFFSAIVEIYLLWNNTIYELTDNMLISPESEAETGRFGLRYLDKLDIDPHLEWILECAERSVVTGEEYHEEYNDNCAVNHRIDSNNPNAKRRSGPLVTRDHLDRKQTT